MKRHLIIIILYCILTAIVSVAEKPSMPVMTIDQMSLLDSIYITFAHKNPEALIYANLYGITDKRCSMLTDKLSLPYWAECHVTAWAEVDGIASDAIICNINNTLETTNDAGAGISIEYSNSNIICKTMYCQFDHTILGRDWVLSAGNQQVELDSTRLRSIIIGDDNGPIDIYSAGASNGALLFGKADENGERAYIQSVKKIMMPAVVDIYMQADAASIVNQSVVVKISFDGVTWASVDTLGKDQLKPIRRYQLKCDMQGEAYIRIESATEPATASALWIYDLGIILLPRERTWLPDIIKTKTVKSVQWYNLLGNLLTTPSYGEFCIEVVTYSDNTKSARRKILYR